MINVQIDERKMFGPASPPPQPSDHGFFARLAASATGPMPVIGYHAMPSRDGRPAPKLVGDDATLLEKTAHVRKPKERMGQFFQRVGLGAAQIRNMSKDEISRFCEVVAQNELGFNRAQDFEPRGMQRTVFLDI